MFVEVAGLAVIHVMVHGLINVQDLHVQAILLIQDLPVTVIVVVELDIILTTLMSDATLVMQAVTPVGDQVLTTAIPATTMLNMVTELVLVIPATGEMQILVQPVMFPV